MADDEKKVEFFGLSTCGWCRRTKNWLDEHNIEYILVYVDKAEVGVTGLVGFVVSAYVFKTVETTVKDDGSGLNHVAVNSA